MTNSIAEYYINELDDWKDLVDFNLEEIDELEEWLQEILNYDSLPILAATVEHNLTQLVLLKQNLHQLKDEMQSLEGKLYKGQTPVDNETVTEEISKHQNSLRDSMNSIEKQYLDIKYACDRFVADTIVSQSKKKES